MHLTSFYCARLEENILYTQPGAVYIPLSQRQNQLPAQVKGIASKFNVQYNRSFPHTDRHVHSDLYMCIF